MRQVDLVRLLRGMTDSSHHIAAINMLQDAMPKELLDPECDWIVCFYAENEPDPQVANYNISSK